MTNLDLHDSIHGMLVRILDNQEKMMAAIDNLKAADTSLQAEVATAIADWASQLANSSSANDPAIQAVADDMQNTIATLRASDPAATVTTPVTAPDGTPQPG